MTKETTTSSTYPELIPVSKFNDYIPHPSTGALRQIMFYDTDNFNEKVVRRIGKRLYIKTSAFYEWIEDTHRKQIA